ncbi:MAG: hypothetical protein ACLQAT_20570 [Candidatus Binataceae bacterium]
MKLSRFLIPLIGMMLLALAGCSTASAPQPTPTLSKEELLQRLEKAYKFDRDSSTAYTRSAPSLDHFYSRKAGQVQEVMVRLNAGGEVSQDDISHALDNSLATTFGESTF